MILELNELSQIKTHPSTYQQKFHNILHLHPDCLYVFTDCSKNNNKTVYTAVLNKNNSQEALSSQ